MAWEDILGRITGPFCGHQQHIVAVRVGPSNSIGNILWYKHWAHLWSSITSFIRNNRSIQEHRQHFLVNSEPIHESKNGHMQGNWKHLSEESAGHFETIGSIFQQQGWAHVGASAAFSGNTVGLFVMTRNM